MKKLFFFSILAVAMSTTSFGHVNLLAPVGGETYNVGDTVKIRWQIAISHTLLNWDLFFSENGGSSWDTLQIDIPSTGNNVGTIVEYDWIVPNNITTTAQIWIYMDNAATDYEDMSGNFTIQTTVGIDNISDKEIFNIYPNPLRNDRVLTLSLPENHIDLSSIHVMDYSGKLIKSFSIDAPAGSLKTRVDLVGLKHGYYYILLEDDKKGIIDKRTLVIL